jgi:hypothetical protein
LFSQGDDYWGKAESVLSVGQPITGQASYRGWILESGPGDSAKDLERLRQLIKAVPYRSNEYGKKSDKSLE